MVSLYTALNSVSKEIPKLHRDAAVILRSSPITKQQNHKTLDNYLHIRQLVIDLSVQKRPLLSTQLTLQPLFRERLELLLRHSIKVYLSQTLLNRFCDGGI